MSLLVAAREQGPAAASTAAAMERALEQARAGGVGQAQVLRWDGGIAHWFATAGQPRSAGACVRQGARWAAYVGAAHRNGRTGEALLRELLDEWSARRGDPAALPLASILGTYALILGDGQSAWLMGDALGLQKIYRATDVPVWSTSFLCCLAATLDRRVRPVQARQYVLLGANHGLQTPFDGVALADPTQMTDLRDGTTRPAFAPAQLRAPQRWASIGAAAEGLASMLDGEFASLVHAFAMPAEPGVAQPAIGNALSGGFDSRLILAALDARGCVPHVFVYGDAHDSDVRIAKQVTAALGMPIEHVDKADLNRDLAPLTNALLQANIDFLDGLPLDGACDLGADRRTREQQMAAGCVQLNGGGGEIFRNFFYLPERRFSMREVVGSFFSGWRPDAMSADERVEFADTLADGLLRSLGLAAGPDERDRPLERRDIELLYTTARLRFWMGRNNSVSTRHGLFLTPLVSVDTVRAAAALPLEWKTDGDLEAAMITRLSPKAAAQPSDYGFDFASGPNDAHRRAMRRTLARPIALRRRMPSIKRLLGRNQSIAVPEAWAPALRDPQALADNPWVRPGAITEPGAWSRLVTLQALVERF